RLAAGGRVGLLQPLDQVGGALLGQFEDLHERARAGTVVRDLRVLLPRAVGVGVEVVAGLYGLVDTGQVHAGDGFVRVSGGRGALVGLRDVGVRRGRALASGKCAGEGDGQGRQGEGTGRTHAQSSNRGNASSCARTRSPHVQEVIAAARGAFPQ